jgi:hypothetical protein
MALYLNTKTGRVVNIKDINVLPDENKNDLKVHTVSVEKPDVLKKLKDAKNKE